MSILTMQTRHESHEAIKEKKQIRNEYILDRLMTGPKTAKEVAVELFELGLIPGTDRNFAAPRLTEMENREGWVRTIDKKKCQYTGKTVAVYEITTEGIERRFENESE